MTDTKQPTKPALPDGMALVRVLKKGDGQVSKGRFDADNGGEQYYDKGEEFVVARKIADALEDRGLVEIQ